MEILSLIWDDANVEHIACYGVSPGEVEDVCFGTHIGRKERSQRYILSGRSASGRHLNVVIEQMGHGIFRPVTAFDMSENYKRRFKRRFL